MERYYQVIIKAPININPGDKVYKFMPGESHSLPEHLGKEIFKDGSPYLEYFSLIEINPPLETLETKEPPIEQLLKASDSPALNTLSTVDKVAVNTLDQPIATVATVAQQVKKASASKVVASETTKNV